MTREVLVEAGGVVVRRGCLAVALSLVWLSPAGAQTDSDWPCIQALVPEVSGGMIWTGPPLDEAAEDRDADPAVSDLAARLAARTTPMQEARADVEAFADSLGPETRDEELTRLFAGVLETINRERASVIRGIKRFSREQRDLGERIVETGAALRELGANGTPEQEARRQELEQQRQWSIRVHDERENSLAYLCEQPVLLEQRAFALGREIAGYLD